MRIIAGLYRSRIIKMVNIETTRETQDKVRGAIFNLLSFKEIDGACLDLFSGSGSMGLEALSRGCEFAVFNDMNKKAYSTTLENIKSLKVEKNTICYNLDYKRCLERLNKKFKYVFLDPPYKLNCYKEIIEYMRDNDLLEQDAIIVLEIGIDTVIGDIEGFSVYKEKEYGIKKVIILEKRD